MENILSAFDVTAPQEAVYRFLLDKGVSTMAEIARGIQHKRPSCQEYVRALEQLGFVNASKEGGRTRYGAEDPDKFSQLMHERLFIFDKLLPQLSQQEAAHQPLNFRLLPLNAVQTIAKRWKKKALLRGRFGTADCGGIITETTLLLYSPNTTIGAFEIHSKELAQFHREILEQ